MSLDRDGGWQGDAGEHNARDGDGGGHRDEGGSPSGNPGGDNGGNNGGDPRDGSSPPSRDASQPSNPLPGKTPAPRRSDKNRRAKREDHQLYYGERTPRRPARNMRSSLANPEVRMMSESDLAKLDAARDVEGTTVIAATPLVEVTSDGSRLESRPYHGLALSSEKRRRHTMVIGATGSGKTYRYGLNAIHAILCDTDESVVYNNLKGPRGTEEVRELVERVAPGTRVIVFAPGDASRSVGINYLLNARRHAFESALVSAILATIERGREGSNYWEQSARPVLETLVRHPMILSIAALSEVLSDGALLEDFARRSGEPSLKTFTMYRESGQNGATSAVDIAARVAPFCATAAARAVASGADELDLVECIASPTRFVLVIECSESTYRTEKYLVSLFLTLLFESLLKVSNDNGGVLPRGVNLIIDEFGVTPQIPDLAETINLGRARGYAFHGLVQTLAQVRATYGEKAEAIFAGCNNTIWFCSGLSVNDREIASRLPGNIVVDDWSTTMRPNLDGTWEEESRTSRSASRPLLLPEDFMISAHPNFGGYAVAMLVDEKPAYVHFTGAWECPDIASALAAARNRPITCRKTPLPAVPRLGLVKGALSAAKAGTASFVTSDTTGWSDANVQQRLEAVLERLDWGNTTGSARKWWLAFMNENKERLRVVLRLAEELEVRRATITEFFLAYVYSNTDNIQANLHYLDYTRLKKEDERKKREAAEERRRADAAHATEEARKQPSEAHDIAVDVNVDGDVDGNVDGDVDADVDADVDGDVELGLELEIDALRRLVQWPKPAKPRARSRDKLRLLDAWASAPGRRRDEVLRLMREIFNLGWKAGDLAATMHAEESSDPWGVLKQMGRRSDGTGV